LRAGRRRGRRTPGVAAASAGGQGAAVRAGPVFHARELPAVPRLEDAPFRHRGMRRGRLDFPGSLDRGVVAGLVRAVDRLCDLARAATPVRGVLGSAALALLAVLTVLAADRGAADL